MYNLIGIIVGPVAYAVLLAASTITLGRAHGEHRDRRWRRFLALQAASTLLALLLAATLTVNGYRWAAACWACTAVTAAVGAALTRRRHRREVTMSPTPAEYEEFTRRFAANHSVTWGGPGDLTPTRHLPCPFCAAVDFAAYTVTPGLDDAHTALTAPHVCPECGRGGRFILTAVDFGLRHYRFVHTIGGAPPPWLPDARYRLVLADPATRTHPAPEHTNRHGRRS